MKIKISFVTSFVLLLCLLLVGAVGAKATVACPTDNAWTGAVDTDWSNSDNWDCNEVPTQTSNVVIPASAAPNFPEVPDSTTVHVNNMTVEAGASFNLNGQLLLMEGTLTNNGSLIDKKAISSSALPNGTCFFCEGGYAGMMLSRANSPSNPAAVQVEIRGNQGTCDSQNSTIGRCFDIQPTISNNISLDAIFYFNPSELNGLTCSQLQMYRFEGGNWSPAGSHVSNDCETTIDPFYNIQTENITDFSPFVASVGAPLAISLVGVNGLSQGAPMLFAAAALLLMVITIGLYFTRRETTSI